MAEKKKVRVTIVVIRGNQSNENNAEKLNQMEIIMRFVKLCNPKAEFMMDDATLMMDLNEEKEGDTAWVMENVMSRMYIDNVRGSEQCQAKAEKLFEICKEKDGVDKVGIGLIRRYLADFYLAQKNSSIYVR